MSTLSAAKPREDKQKKKRKPRRYEFNGTGARRYMCPEHDKWFVLTPKQAKAQEPIVCAGHEIIIDFSHIDRIIMRGF